MPRPLLSSLRRRLPRWLGPVLAVLLLCQQVALAAHLCVGPLDPPRAVDACMASMEQHEHAPGTDQPTPACAAHCANPVQQALDLLPLGVPPLPLPVLVLPRKLLAAHFHPDGGGDEDPGARGWRAAHACTVLLI